MSTHLKTTKKRFSFVVFPVERCEFGGRAKRRTRKVLHISTDYIPNISYRILELKETANKKHS